jgi:Protein of unknown function (DUF1553)/Protein of unknown function (DUF1549)/Planctomycete cytochrome C
MVIKFQQLDYRSIRTNRFREIILTGILALLVFLILLIFSSALFASEKVSTDKASNKKLSFKKDIQPIFKEKCSRCHNEKSKKADFDLSNIKSILKGGESGEGLDFEKPEESLLYEYVHEEVMPPEDEPPLSSKEKKLICEWVLQAAQSKEIHSSINKTVSQHDVIPTLLLHCGTCHGAQRQEAGLDIRSKQSLLKGGKSGPAIVLGNPEESLILKKIHSEKMPPREKLAFVSVKIMSSHEINVLTEWIKAGAPETVLEPDIATTSPDPLVSNDDRQFWAFQPPKHSTLPKVKNSRLIKTPIDLFIQNRLEKIGLEISPAADRATLIRRAYFDLIGLPPTPKQVKIFLEDNNQNAFDRVIDELLASPRYGERWGQYWLDLAGYSDSEGGQHADIIRKDVWHYRDYVIRAFNNDKPYDQFLLEQIAGDELVKHDPSQEISEKVKENLIATGFLRMAPDGTYAPITGFIEDRLAIINDEIEIFSSSVLGLTLKCARCHTHKFDPIPQRDYYRLAAIFKGAYDENDWIPPNEKGGHLPKNALIRMITVPENKEVGQKKKEPLAIRALWDRGEPTNTYLLIRGDYRKRGQLIGPGVPSVLTDGKTPFPIKKPWSGSKKTGRRLALAKWLIEPKNPLTSRVMVNRIWKHHFSEGIVSTLDNFGVTGSRPSHPELLDWLALRFIKEGWSIKSLHRLIMKSSVYQQSSRITVKKNERDPENHYLSRMPLKRMDAEVLRDSLFYIAGLLDLTPFGKPDPLKTRKDGLVTSQSGGKEKGKWRRSIYQLKRRTQPLTILENYDAPKMNPNCVTRTESIVAPQALHLLNNKLVKEVADVLADRIHSKSRDNLNDQIESAYQICLGRKPIKNERRISRESIKNLMAAWKVNTPHENRIIQASKELWIRESEPVNVFEDDLISVWSKSSSDKSRRWGLVEFDLSGINLQDVHSIFLNLGPTRESAISQRASLISAGIEKMTWSKYQKEKASSEIKLTGLGRIIVNNAAQVLSEDYYSSEMPTEKDLIAVREFAGKHGKLTLVLKADENGTLYNQDWDDGKHKSTRGNPPQLIIIGSPLTETELQRRSLQNFCHALVNSAAFLFIN